MNRLGTLWLALACATLPLAGQEAIQTPAATLPGLGSVVLREQLRFFHADQDPTTQREEIDELQSLTTLTIGYEPDVALGVTVPLAWRSFVEGNGQERDQLRTGDVRAFAKWRFYREDTAAIDTTRAAMLAGFMLPTGEGTSLRPGFSDDSFDPFLGVALTQIRHRHGLGLAAEYRLSTSGHADLFEGDLAYLYRLEPAEFSTTSTSAFYGVAEVNLYYETNGDVEALLAPGLMYEARTFTIEFGIQIPLVQELDHRAEIDYGVTLGMRVTF